VKKILLFIALLPIIGFSQEGKPIKSIAIPRVDLPKPDSKPETSANAPQYSISKPFEPKIFKVPPKVYEAPKEESKVSMTPQKSDLDPGKQFSDKLNKTEAEKMMPMRGNITYGKIETIHEFVYLSYKDYDQIDGDIIRVLIDNSVIKDNVTLGGDFVKIKVRLVEGVNNFVFLALNEGLGSPNTAQFQVEDLQGNVLFANSWGLLTGYHASINVYRKVNPNR
jgi:hypothetical protein